jgi:hypothetical protein
MTQLRRLTQLHQAQESHLERGEELTVELLVPRSRREALALALKELFQGRGRVWS